MGQAEKPADNTKVFGAKPPKEIKALQRSVNGTVKDQDGNPVSGAVVYLKDTRTSKSRTVTTGPDGGYRFEELSTAVDYELRAEKEPAASLSKKLSSFDTRKAPVMNLALEAPAKAASK